MEKSLRDLRIDRRMINRRNWIEPEELASELGSLPDVSDKIGTEDDADTAPESESESGVGPGEG